MIDDLILPVVLKYIVPLKENTNVFLQCLETLNSREKLNLNKRSCQVLSSNISVDIVHKNIDDGKLSFSLLDK